MAKRKGRRTGLHASRNLVALNPLMGKSSAHRRKDISTRQHGKQAAREAKNNWSRDDHSGLTLLGRFLPLQFAL